MARDRQTLDLYLTHRGELVNYAASILGDRAHAEDVVQEAYLKFDAAAVERSLGEPVAYLYRIVRNLSLDLHRVMKRDRNRVLDDLDAIVDRLELPRPSPEAEVGAREELRIVGAAMAGLSERQRRALEMHRLGGRPLKEIAVELGVSIGTAHGLVADALEHCRESLARARRARKF